MYHRIMYHWIKKYIPDTARQRRLLEAQKKVVQVASSPAVAAGDLGRVGRDICKTCADWLVVERASVWLLNEQQTELELVCLYSQMDGIFEGGASLRKEKYPSYFKALLTGRAIDAHNAKNDLRTQEFSIGYLDIHHIESMLDAAVRNGDQVIGVVCCEKTHKRRHWHIDDINFCAEMADQLAHTIANKNARAAHEKMLRFEAVSQSKSQFLATISHEIRTPLNAIIGMTDQLQDTPLNQEQQEIIEILKRSGDFLRSIINNVLDFSKIESGKIDITDSEVNINFIVSECLSIFKKQAKEKNIELIFTPHPSLKIIMMDGVHLTQVISNLMGNAIKYTQAGSIHVRILNTENRLKIRVIDTGCGISDDLRSRLFMPFEQEKSVLSNGIKGTGLGLAISKRYIEAMEDNYRLKAEWVKAAIFALIYHWWRFYYRRYLKRQTRSKYPELLPVACTFGLQKMMR